MNSADGAFYNKLVATFNIEATEHLQFLATALTELESALAQTDNQARLTVLESDTKTLIENMYRRFHSLKGAAHAVGFNEIEKICQLSESRFDQLKKGEAELSAVMVDELYRAVADISAELATSEPKKTSASSTEPESMMPETRDVTETVRVSRAKLEQLLYQTEALIPITFDAELHAVNIVEINQQREHLNRKAVAANGKSWQQLATGMDKLHQEITRNYRQLHAAVAPLLTQVRGLMLQPFGEVTDLMLPAIKAIARAQDKAVDFVVHGADNEIDRRVLDGLRDALLHLARNAVDHGIESKADRLALGKPEHAKITLLIEPISDTEIKITLTDDGVGIDDTKVALAAEKLGLGFAAERGFDRTALLQLIFHSGLSTAAKTTELSGRGIGLAIVRETVEKLSGSLSVESEPGCGTSFSLVVPLTLSTLRSVLVRCNQHVFALPNYRVKQAIRVQAQCLQFCENRYHINWCDESVAVIKLQQLLGLPVRDVQFDTQALLPILIVEAMGEKLALVVDEILAEQEVLVKSLGPQLVRVPNVVGATLLPSGDLGIILNVADLVMAAKYSGFALQAELKRASAEASSKRVLIAEDSITSRMLLKNILETAGYETQTAVDGADALNKVRQAQFDLLISDIEMPQLNGFELTQRIRQDHALAELPIILVTSLNAAEDKERGVEAGANAYLVKGDLDEFHLLSTVRGLI